MCNKTKTYDIGRSYRLSACTFSYKNSGVSAQEVVNVCSAPKKKCILSRIDWGSILRSAIGAFVGATLGFALASL